MRASRTWTGLAGSGRMALIDHRDVAEAGWRVLTEPALWGAHHDLTGPVPLSSPEALELLSAELGEPVTFRVAAERQFLDGLLDAGVPVGTAELLITREWSILAGENDYTTDTFQQITGRPRARWPSSFTTTARNSSNASASPRPIPAEVQCADQRPTRRPVRPKLTFIARLIGFSVALAIGELSPVAWHLGRCARCRAGGAQRGG